MTASVYCRALPTGLTCVPVLGPGTTDPAAVPAGPRPRGSHATLLLIRSQAGHDQLRAMAGAARDTSAPAGYGGQRAWPAKVNRAAHSFVDLIVKANDAAEVPSGPVPRHPRPNRRGKFTGGKGPWLLPFPA
ncbi:MAG TPA: hypothetical protein VGX23_21210 [Actinocrinis sp.]|nr:hypothetical protein [Actinocrinis sp.]